MQPPYFDLQICRYKDSNAWWDKMQKRLLMFDKMKAADQGDRLFSLWLRPVECVKVEKQNIATQCSIV